MKLCSWFSPCIKNPNILFIRISSIGWVFIKLWSKYERVHWCIPNTFLLHTLQLVQSSLIFELSNCQSGHPYNDEHWLINRATFACQDIGLNLLIITFVRIFISFIIESKLMIEFDTWNRWPKCVSDFTFSILWLQMVMLIFSKLSSEQLKIKSLHFSGLKFKNILQKIIHK